ncbi:MAG: hypothetical protein ABSC37_18545, partial [Xanthobacteraceae bacterium]
GEAAPEARASGNIRARGAEELQMRFSAFRFLSYFVFLGISFLSWLAEPDRAESRSHRRLRRDAILLRGTILRMALA